MLMPDKSDPNYASEVKRMNEEVKKAKEEAQKSGEKFVPTSFGIINTQPTK